VRTLTITPADAGLRLDRFLTRYLNRAPRSTVYKLLRKRVIKVNDQRAHEDDRLAAGDVVTLFLSDETHDALHGEVLRPSAAGAGLDVVFEDDEVLIVDKPAGLLTHPEPGEYRNTLATHVQRYLGHLCTRGFRPAPANRLDQNTSGLVIFGKTEAALHRLGEALARREVQKVYQAIVHGRLDAPGEVRGVLHHDPRTNQATVLPGRDDGSGKAVHTRYLPLAVKPGFTLVEVEILTGRTHQIRASLAAIGHPVVGDEKYGGCAEGGLDTQALHAFRLVIDGRTFERPSAALRALWDTL